MVRSLDYSVRDGGGIFDDTSNTVVNGTPDVDDYQYEGESVDPINVYGLLVYRPDYFGNDQERVGFTGSIQWAAKIISTNARRFSVQA